MSYGKGCKPPVIAPHLHRLSFRMHPAVRAAITLASSIDLRETNCIATVKDQGSTGSCEGHSCSGVTESQCALDGAPLGFTPSEAVLYGGARSVERARFTPVGDTLPALLDQGAVTDDVLTFMQTYGVRARRVQQTSDGRNSDVEVATVNDDLTLDDFEKAAVQLITGPYAIDPQASDVEQQVQASLSAKIVVRVDAFVDSAFEDWSPGKAPVPAPDTSDPNGGGHAIYIVGYASGFYWVRNSWGTSWGDGGDVRVSPSWLRSAWALYPWTVRRAA